ncbi:Protein CBG25274 [Caenorhabditis briggsae]|uniref:Protein CBG25274 n=1 Tax=Caenorhabditis briggsae TaxID=6238 RepID=B6IIJ2_CAEBR|nr:Protein CBG25274 [Caenorhabditis briggsae]CAR99722.1 Protein CBG25274 [Caenorhabditis briggsae]
MFEDSKTPVITFVPYFLLINKLSN